MRCNPGNPTINPQPKQLAMIPTKLCRPNRSLPTRLKTMLGPEIAKIYIKYADTKYFKVLDRKFVNNMVLFKNKQLKI